MSISTNWHIWYWDIGPEYLCWMRSSWVLWLHALRINAAFFWRLGSSFDSCGYFLCVELVGDCASCFNLRVESEPSWVSHVYYIKWDLWLYFMLSLARIEFALCMSRREITKSCESSKWHRHFLYIFGLRAYHW